MMCAACRKINHYKEVCRSSRKNIHRINKETDQYQREDDIYMVNINSINVNSKLSVITANLKTSSNQAIIVIPHNVDICSDENIMCLHNDKKLFSRASKEQLAATRNENIKLKAYNSTTITLYDRYKSKNRNQ